MFEEFFCDTNTTNNRMSTTPANKRPNTELGSPESPSQALLHKLNNIETKLDMINELRTEIADLKTSVEFTNTLHSPILKKDNIQLKKEVKDLQITTVKLEVENKHLRESILDLKCRSMRNNIVISGMREEEAED